MNHWNTFSRKVLEKSLSAASKVSGGREYVAAATNKVNGLVKGKSPRNFLKLGNIIQIVSRSSDRTIQIVMSRNSNVLVCDAVGGLGSQYLNAHWIVACSSTGRYYFHNNFNYLALKNGQPVIIPSSGLEKPPAEAEFLVQDVFGSSHGVYLETPQAPSFVLSFDQDGVPIEKKKFKVNDRSSQFEIHLIAYGPGIEPENDTHVIEKPDDSAPPSYAAATAESK